MSINALMLLLWGVRKSSALTVSSCSVVKKGCKFLFYSAWWMRTGRWKLLAFLAAQEVLRKMALDLPKRAFKDAQFQHLFWFDTLSFKSSNYITTKIFLVKTLKIAILPFQKVWKIVRATVFSQMSYLETILIIWESTLPRPLLKAISRKVRARGARIK